MPIIKMCEVQQYWDIEFFRAYVPTLIAQLDKIDSVFEIFVRAISQLHHRLTSIIIAQPHRFKIKNMQLIYDKIKDWVHKKSQESKQEMNTIGQTLREFKGATVQLRNYFYQCQSKAKDIVQRKQKLQRQYQDIHIQVHQFAKLQQPQHHHCGYYYSENRVALTSLAQQNQQYFLKQKLQYLKIQVDQLRAKQQICVLQENNRMRMSLDRVNKCVDRVLKFNSSLPPQFQTFNKNGGININHESIKYGNNEGQMEKQPKISQFKFKKQELQHINQIIREAENICQKQAYKKPNQMHAQIVLSAAILAQSQQDIDFRQNIKNRNGGSYSRQ